MSFEFTCQCGKVLSAESDWVGRQARCPGCQAVLTVPEMAEAVSATQPADSAIEEFYCACGKLLSAQAGWIGKKVRCPGCKTILIVPGPTTSSAEENQQMDVAVDEDQSTDEAAQTDDTDSLTNNTPQQPSDKGDPSTHPDQVPIGPSKMDAASQNELPQEGESPGRSDQESLESGQNTIEGADEFEFRCPCDKLLMAELDWVGRKVRCPSCKAILRVPEPNGESARLDNATSSLCSPAASMDNENTEGAGSVSDDAVSAIDQEAVEPNDECEQSDRLDESPQEQREPENEHDEGSAEIGDQHDDDAERADIDGDGANDGSDGPGVERLEDEFEFQCPCGKLLVAELGWIGKKVRCPDCRAVLVVPGPIVTPVTDTQDVDELIQQDALHEKELSSSGQSVQPEESTVSDRNIAASQRSGHIKQRWSSAVGRFRPLGHSVRDWAVHAKVPLERLRPLVKSKMKVAAVVALALTSVIALSWVADVPTSAPTVELSGSQHADAAQDTLAEPISPTIAHSTEPTGVATDSQHESMADQEGQKTAIVSGHTDTDIPTTVPRREVDEHPTHAEQTSNPEHPTSNDAHISAREQAALMPDATTSFRTVTDSQAIDSGRELSAEYVSAESNAEYQLDSELAMLAGALEMTGPGETELVAPSSDTVSPFTSRVKAEFTSLADADDVSSTATTHVMAEPTQGSAKGSVVMGHTGRDEPPATVEATDWLRPERVSEQNRRDVASVTSARFFEGYARRGICVPTGQEIAVFLDMGSPATADATLTDSQGSLLSKSSLQLLRNIAADADTLATWLDECLALSEGITVLGKRAEHMRHVIVFPARSIASGLPESFMSYRPGHIRTWADLVGWFGPADETELWLGRNGGKLGLSGSVYWWQGAGIAASAKGEITHILLRGPLPSTAVDSALTRAESNSTR